MGFNKKFFTTGGIVASSAAPTPAAFDPLQNFETVTYTGNGSTQKITGYIRKGAAFNGSSSYIATSYTLPSDSTMSFSFWVNVAAFGAGDTYIMSDMDSSTNDRRLDFRFNSSGYFMVDVGNGSSNDTGNTDSVTQPTNTWIHFAVVLNGTSLKVYKNGNSTPIVDTTLTVAFGTAGGRSLTLGRAGDYTGSAHLNGKLDQFRIFNTALNSTQVGQLAGETYGDAKNSVTDFFGNGTGVALYQLDEDASDTAGAGQSGYIGDAAKFNGSSSQIALNNLSIGAGDFTVSLWMKPTAITNANYHMTFAQNGYSGGTGIAMYTLGTSTTTANFVPYISVGGTAYNIVSSSGISVNQWTHLALVRDYGNNWKAYMNGTLLTTYTSAGLTTDFTNSISYLGRHGNGLYRFNGYIDDVRIYSSALDSNDIGYIANNNTANIPTSNLSYHYELETDATDSAGSVDGVETDITYGYAGTPTNVNFLGMAFQPDFVWIKTRSDIGGSNHFLFDSVRGATNRIFSNLTLSEAVDTDSLLSFDSNGFTVGDDISCNGNGESVVAWCWKSGGNASTYNIDGTGYATLSAAGLDGGSISSSNYVGASINSAAGFGIYKYISDGATTVTTFSHGLPDTPKLIITKGLDTNGTLWGVYSEPTGNKRYLQLSETDGQSNASTYDQFNSDTSNIGIRQGGFAATNENCICYAFCDIDGYQKIGSYTGDNPNTVTVDLGFVPRWIMIKPYANYPSGMYWQIVDVVRESSLDRVLYANASDAEADFTSVPTYMQPLSIANGDSVDGFSTTGANSAYNYSGASYLYLAIA